MGRSSTVYKVVARNSDDWLEGAKNFSHITLGYVNDNNQVSFISAHVDDIEATKTSTWRADLGAISIFRQSQDRICEASERAEKERRNRLLENANIFQRIRAYFSRIFN